MHAHRASRPRGDAPTFLVGSRINRNQVSDLVRFGASTAAVISFLRIPLKLLQDARFAAALRKEIESSAAAREIDLRRLERGPQDFSGEFLAGLRSVFRHCDQAHAKGVGAYRKAIAARGGSDAKV